jgi:CRISPR-associated protein Cas2
VRHRAGEVCKDYGLQRAQWSVFEGPMTRNRREELWARLVAMLATADGGGRAAIYPIGRREAACASRWSTLGVRPKTAAAVAAGRGGDDDG